MFSLSFLALSSKHSSNSSVGRGFGALSWTQSSIKSIKHQESFNEYFYEFCQYKLDSLSPYFKSQLPYHNINDAPPP